MERYKQNQIVAAMEAPNFYPHPVTCIDRRETHISLVFLTGTYAYKIKKPVNLGFLDFTALDKRMHACLQEVALNRRLAHDIYLDVVPITMDGGKFIMGGTGDIVEYAVKMRQLSDRCSMTYLMGEGKIGKIEIENLALKLTEFYDHASIGRHISMYGEWDRVQDNCEENFTQMAQFAGRFFDAEGFRVVRAATRSFLRRWRALFEQRVEKGKIRDCHGDLRCEHIYYVEGIQIIDCIEFNDRFRYGDSAADLAFLAMDFDFQGHPEAAEALLREYVRYSKDQDMFVLLDFYKCYRAFVRAKVNCFRLQQGDLNAEEREVLLRDTARYMSLAYRYAVLFTRPTIWVICGLPASGKSSISEELGRVLEIKVLSSDMVRKGLFNVGPNQERATPFEQGIYSKRATLLTYGRLLLLAQEEVEMGKSVILDATFGSRHNRDEVVRLARDKDVNLIFVQCVCPDIVLQKRLKQREKAGSVSDARIQHFEKIKAAFDPLDEVADDMYIRINTLEPMEKNLQEILSQDYCLLSRQVRGVIQRQG